MRYDAGMTKRHRLAHRFAARFARWLPDSLIERIEYSFGGGCAEACWRGDEA
jgi:hypothetical protein